ncbi:helix-turn-helix transcriptional regulator [Micromonospora sp. NPDC050397]|uniref:helix-turn-helix domain-containing protein n=1 Tax=Micromonospora sp. NPDC050397 TaxID=3364279 RepID=UPI00384CC5D5
MPVTPLQFFLRELRKRREAVPLTQDELGRKIAFSASHVSAVELGNRPPKEDYLTVLDQALNTGGLFLSMWQDLVKDEAAPRWLREWLEYEREAIALRWYEPAYVPGLLQTEAYARATVMGARLTPDQAEQRVLSRLERQSVLTRDPLPQAYFVLDEQVIRRPCGRPGVMAEQLEHLVTQAEQEHIQLHLVPAEVGMYPGLAGAFILAELPDNFRVGHVDTQLKAQIVLRADDVANLSMTWESVRGIALPRGQSLDLLKEVAKTWT